MVCSDISKLNSLERLEFVHLKQIFKKVTTERKQHLVTLQEWIPQNNEKDISTEHSPVPQIIIFSTPSPKGIWKPIDLLELFHGQSTYTTKELIVWKTENKRQILHY